jgi:hypothetical protein
MPRNSTPAKNSSSQAVLLRKAALAFSKHAPLTVADSTNEKGRRLNLALLNAAIAYARVADPLYRKAGVLLSDIDIGLVDGSLLDNGVLEFLDENVRDLTCELLGHKTRCQSVDVCRERQENAGLRSKGERP